MDGSAASLAGERVATAARGFDMRPSDRVYLSRADLRRPGSTWPSHLSASKRWPGSSLQRAAAHGAWPTYVTASHLPIDSRFGSIFPMASSCPQQDLGFLARVQIYVSLPRFLRRTHSERLLPDEQPGAPDLVGSQLCSRSSLERLVPTPCAAWRPPRASWCAFSVHVLHIGPVRVTLAAPRPGCGATSTYARSRARVLSPPACAGSMHVPRGSSLSHARICT